MAEELFLPSLPHWQFGNFWSGSKGTIRYYITVSDGEHDKEMLLEIWHLDVCRELADITQTKTFPVTQEGLDAMREFLRGL